MRTLRSKLGALAVLPVAAVAAGLTPTTANAAPQATGSSYTYLEFKKGSDPLNSRLRFVHVQRIGGDRTRTTVLDSWRAGSGNGSKDTCASNQGWLPDGTYPIGTYYPHHDGGPHGVNGIAWDIGNHKCHTGKWRTELFIHSRMLPSGAQGSGPYQWTGSYTSNGCIKLSPHDVRELQNRWNTYPHPGKLYVN